MAANPIAVVPLPDMPIMARAMISVAVFIINTPYDSSGCFCNDTKARWQICLFFLIWSIMVVREQYCHSGSVFKPDACNARIAIF